MFTHKEGIAEQSSFDLDNLHSGDSGKELERLKEEERVINTYVREWAESAQSQRPAFVHGGLAGDIVKQCTPLPGDVVASISSEPSPFTFGAVAKSALKKKERIAQQDRAVLTRIARDDTLDMLEIEDPYFAKSFDVLGMMQQNPGIAHAYSDAIPYLRRLFIEREQIALSRHQTNSATIDFMFILNRLLDDL